jgi:hypothetical protein
MTLVSSIRLKLHSLVTIVIIYDRHMFIVQATGPPFLLTKPENVNKMDQWLVL